MDYGEGLLSLNLGTMNLSVQGEFNPMQWLRSYSVNVDGILHML